MEGFDQLSLIAEIAATFAGFIAIFIAFSRDDGRFSDGDKHFIQAIVLNSAFVIVFALAPQVFSHLFDLERVWKLSAWCALAVGSIIAVYVAIQQFHMDEDEADSIHFIWHFVAWGFGTLTYAAIILGLMYPAMIAGTYVVAMSILLINVIWCFIAIVFRKFF